MGQEGQKEGPCEQTTRHEPLTMRKRLLISSCLLVPNSNSPVHHVYDKLVPGDYVHSVLPIFWFRHNRDAFLQQLQSASVVEQFFGSAAADNDCIQHLCTIIQAHDNLITTKLFDSGVIGHVTDTKNVRTIFAALCEGGIDEFNHVIRFFELHKADPTRPHKIRWMDIILEHAPTSELFYAIQGSMQDEVIFSVNGAKHAVRHGYRDVVDIMLQKNDGDISWMARSMHPEHLIRHGWFDLIKELQTKQPNLYIHLNAVLKRVIQCGNEEMFMHFHDSICNSNTNRRARYYTNHSLSPVSDETQKVLALHGTVNMIMTFLLQVDQNISINQLHWAFLHRMFISNPCAAEVLRRIFTDHIDSRVWYLIRRDHKHIMRQILSSGKNWPAYKELRRCIKLTFATSVSHADA